MELLTVVIIILFTSILGISMCFLTCVDLLRIFIDKLIKIQPRIVEWEMNFLISLGIGFLSIIIFFIEMIR
jgi:hypothetical protein